MSPNPAGPAAHRLRAAGRVRGRAALARPRPGAGRARRRRAAARLPRLCSHDRHGRSHGRLRGAGPSLARGGKAPDGEAARAGHPIWGVCLGSQLLAGALGARVYPGEEAEVGLLPVELTPAAAEDPVFGHAPSEFPTLQWHGDSFDLPDGATLLASSPAYPNQAFRFERAYGLQSHLEVTPELAAEWGGIPAYAQSLEKIRGSGALDRLVDEVGAYADTTVPLARGLFGRWLERVARVPAGAIG